MRWVEVDSKLRDKRIHDGKQEYVFRYLVSRDMLWTHVMLDTGTGLVRKKFMNWKELHVY